ncbi:hypothetical protein INR49_026694 [Caranx melampygus]|nr:hypothetical protein INR49_026694 [Caranx melampygus]
MAEMSEACRGASLQEDSQEADHSTCLMAITDWQSAAIFVKCLLASTSLLRPPVDSWAQWTVLWSLSETLLDGNIGEQATELLNDPHVYLGAEGDVQEEKLRTGLEEFLQRGRLRARCWKHPVLLCRVGHQPRSNSSSILNNHRTSRETESQHSEDRDLSSGTAARMEIWEFNTAIANT